MSEFDVFLVLHGSKVNIFGFWTISCIKQDIWQHQLRLWATVNRYFSPFSWHFICEIENNNRTQLSLLGDMAGNWEWTYNVVTNRDRNERPEILTQASNPPIAILWSVISKHLRNGVFMSIFATSWLVVSVQWYSLNEHLCVFSMAGKKCMTTGWAAVLHY